MSVPIVIAGKNEIACNTLEYVIKHHSEHKIYVIVNKTEEGVDGWQPSLQKRALTNEIQIITLAEAYDLSDCIFLSCEFDTIVKPTLFHSQKLYNIHFSKLPEYKGMYTSCLPILHDKHETGVTLHKIDQGIDTGDIIDQVTFAILPEYTAYDLYIKYNSYGTDLIQRNFNNIVEDNVISHVQTHVNASYYSIKTIDFKNLRVNYRKTANEIKNQIHAYSFLPYQLPLFNDIRIIKAEVLSDKSNYPPGQILEKTNEYIIISSIDYNVKLHIY